MKISIRILALALATMALASQTTFAQEAVQQSTTTTTTTNSAGTVTQFSPDAIVIKTESSTEPVHYTYTKTTTYVDENGAPVSMELVKSGVPVTVYYTKEGDKMIATKVVVRHSDASGGTTVDKKTTTTTTTDK
ncbi:MAG TPA: hypothetical protein VG733_19045 [Chthoniobacteraceae bacterium]|nr:hypothetical protein [Chthoniobacteraceae bacterium]